MPNKAPDRESGQGEEQQGDPEVSYEGRRTGGLTLSPSVVPDEAEETVSQ